MRTVFKYMMVWVVMIVTAMGAFSCIKDKYPPNIPPGGGEDQKVSLEIYALPDDYSLAGTRADENTFDKEPVVMVFKGHGNSAVFSEVNRAKYDGTISSVALTMTDYPVTLLLVSNLYGKDFFNGTANVTFNEENITHALANRSLSQVHDMGLLRTASLGASLLSTLPYSGASETIPMSALCELPSISAGQAVGSASNMVRLVRSMAKVTVEVAEDINPIFRLNAVAVVNAPRNGSLYYYNGIPADNNDNLVRYGNESGGMAQATPNSSGIYTTQDYPIYLYESRADQGTGLIIKGEVDGAYKYFSLPFYDRNGYIPILRNKHYTFRIVAVGSGYDSLDEAISSPGIPDFKFEVIVTDSYSYDMVSDEKIYIGVSASWIDSFVQSGHSASITVYTDATMAAGYSTSVTSDEGITVSPQALNLAYSSLTTGITHLDIQLNANFRSGRVVVRIGTLTKTIQVVRHERQAQAGVPLELPYDDYVLAESLDADWLFVSHDGVDTLPSLEKDAPGKMYIITEGVASGILIGEVQAVRNRTGRSVIYIGMPQ